MISPGRRCVRRNLTEIVEELEEGGKILIGGRKCKLGQRGFCLDLRTKEKESLKII